ncbi:FAD:protein FMN transferase [Pectinatus haikarae]|uniref:FAD:protein FMN transferase n=1 Tax=Pectinatus haikarae TaxID=349096 RepID=A0ABT9Y841_9FIRM|nr:FAD:protein FMN transferase [Pectinatus haikarae]MDQ0204008.1 thiamine biosynthesis lipoprotein [Pectinatus haikarae]
MTTAETCYVESKHGMGTFLRVMSFAKEGTYSFTPIWDIFGNVEYLCSRFSSDSQLSLINRMAGKKSVHVDRNLVKILRAAQRISAFTDGIFDITAGAVTGLWHRESGKIRIPAETEQINARSLVNYQWLDVSDSEVFLQKANMKLDLGGIAKEFALHAAAAKAEETGMGAAIIDAGGDICTVGAKPNNRAWRIGIQHPRREKSLLASVVLQNWDTVETSGDYKRYIKDGDKVYSHIFSEEVNDEGGKLISASLIYKRRDDLLPINGTALIAGGLAKAKSFLKMLPRVEAILVTDAMQVFMTEGLRGYVHILPYQARHQTFIINRRAC